MPSSEPSEPGQPSKEPQPPMPYEESPIVSLVPVPPVVSSMPLFEDVLIEALTMPAVSVPEPSTISTSNGRPTPDQRLILGVGSVPVGARWKSQLSARKEALSVPSDFTVDDCIAFLRTMRDASRADNPTPISASDDQTQPPTSAALKMPTPSSSDNAPGNGISMHTAEALQGLLPSPTASTNASEERISPVVVDNAPRSRLYILDSLTGKLVGCVYIEDLLLCEDRTKLVESIRRECEVVILDTEPLNNAAHIMRDRSLYNAAVVNSDYMLVGVLSAGDIIQEMEIEASEEIYRFGGLGSTMDSQDQFSESYFSVPSRRFITSRSSWLVTLLLLQSVSSLVLHHFQPLIEKNVILALFLTMLTGSAGNAGSQSSAIVIRGLATREINKDNAFELISRELLIGLCIAVILGGVAFVRVFITSGMSTAAVTAALTVGIALMLTVIFGILFGTIAPLVFHRLGIDPANASPALSTITDISGVLILCIVATLLLR